MKRNVKFAAAISCGLGAAVLDSASLPGIFGLADFSLAFAAFCIIALDTDLMLAACIAAGLALDISSSLRIHTVSFLMFAAAAKYSTRIFYSRRSPAAVAIQLFLMTIAEGVLYVCAFYPFAHFAPEPHVFLQSATAGVALAASALAVAAAASNRFKAYRI